MKMYMKCKLISLYITFISSVAIKSQYNYDIYRS